MGKWQMKQLFSNDETVCLFFVLRGGGGGGGTLNYFLMEVFGQRSETPTHKGFFSLKKCLI